MGIIPKNYTTVPTAESSPGVTYSHIESSNAHYKPFGLRVFNRIMNKKCLVSDPYSLKTSYTSVKFNS